MEKVQIKIKWDRNGRFRGYLGLISFREKLKNSHSVKMTNKGIPEMPLFYLFSRKMSCPLFGVPTVDKGLLGATMWRKITVRLSKVFKIVCCENLTFVLSKTTGRYWDFSSK